MGLRNITGNYWYNFYVENIPKSRRKIENSNFSKWSRLAKPMRFAQRGLVTQSDLRILCILSSLVAFFLHTTLYEHVCMYSFSESFTVINTLINLHKLPFNWKQYNTVIQYDTLYCKMGQNASYAAVARVIPWKRVCNN